MEEFVYKIRRKSDGKWYGNVPKFAGYTNRNDYFSNTGRFMTKRQLIAVVKSRRTQGKISDFHRDMEVIKYKYTEVERIEGIDFVAKEIKIS